MKLLQKMMICMSVLLAGLFVSVQAEKKNVGTTGVKEVVVESYKSGKLHGQKRYSTGISLSGVSTIEEAIKKGQKIYLLITDQKDWEKNPEEIDITHEIDRTMYDIMNAHPAAIIIYPDGSTHIQIDIKNASAKAVKPAHHHHHHHSKQAGKGESEKEKYEPKLVITVEPPTVAK